MKTSLNQTTSHDEKSSSSRGIWSSGESLQVKKKNLQVKMNLILFGSICLRKFKKKISTLSSNAGVTNVFDVIAASINQTGKMSAYSSSIIT